MLLRVLFCVRIYQIEQLGDYFNGLLTFEIQLETCPPLF